eukprot:7971991-Heterocapsa_arctica.AAC.1
MTLHFFAGHQQRLLPGPATAASDIAAAAPTQPTAAPWDTARRPHREQGSEETGEALGAATIGNLPN